MPHLLEITSNDIEKLDDTKLRELVGLLCEADYRRANLSYQRKPLTADAKLSSVNDEKTSNYSSQL